MVFAVFIAFRMDNHPAFQVFKAEWKIELRHISGLRFNP